MLAMITVVSHSGEAVFKKPCFHCWCTETVNQCFPTGLLYTLCVFLPQDPPHCNIVERSLFTGIQNIWFKCKVQSTVCATYSGTP